MESKYETVLYSRDNCQWCERVKQLMDSVKFPYIEYKYGVDFTRKEFYAEFGEGATFPQVQIDNKHIGGCKDTLHYLQEQGII
tara:strand:- start:96 stop:344 length:249 start_codon:yes stop_codon:yes gene_type:complete